MSKYPPSSYWKRRAASRRSEFGQAAGCRFYTRIKKTADAVFGDHTGGLRVPRDGRGSELADFDVLGFGFFDQGNLEVEHAEVEFRFGFFDIQ